MAPIPTLSSTIQMTRRNTSRMYHPSARQRAFRIARAAETQVRMLEIHGNSRLIPDHIGHLVPGLIEAAAPDVHGAGSAHVHHQFPNVPHHLQRAVRAGASVETGSGLQLLCAEI